MATLSEALEIGRKAWVEQGVDTTVDVGDSVFFFTKGVLTMIQDENGKIVDLPEGSILVRP